VKTGMVWGEVRLLLRAGWDSHSCYWVSAMAWFASEVYANWSF